MRLKVMLPTEVFVDEQITKMVAEDENGSFGILPHHLDFVTALVPGILIYEDEDEAEHYVAVARGIIVKRGSEILVSVRQAMRSDNLKELRRTVEERFQLLDERERKTRAALARLEASFVQRFLELEET